MTALKPQSNHKGTCQPRREDLTTPLSYYFARDARGNLSTLLMTCYGNRCGGIQARPLVLHRSTKNQIPVKRDIYQPDCAFE
jgi:hypothetical protein